MPAEPTEPKAYTQEYVSDLRAEAANWRTKFRALEEESLPVFQKGYLPPEVKFSNTDVAIFVPKFPKGDVDNFSLTRAAYAQDQAFHGNPGEWDRIAPWEKQYIQAIRGVSYKANLGDQVSGQDGAYLAPEFWSTQWFDVLRSMTAIDQLPIQRFNMPYRKSYIPKITNDVTVYYPGENGTATTSVYKFGVVTATPRKAIAYYRASNELIRDAGDVADGLFRRSTASALATDRDTQIFIGSTASGGGPTPSSFITMAVAGQCGLYYPGSSSSSPLSSSARTGTPFYQTIAQLIGKVEILNSNANVSSGQAVCDGIAAHAQIKQTIFSSPNFLDNSNRPLWFIDPSGDGGLFGCKWGLSNTIPTSTTVNGQAGSIVVAGWWEKFALFECLTLGYGTTQESQAYANDQTEIRLVHRWDAAPINPEAFVVLAGVAV